MHRAFLCLLWLPLLTSGCLTHRLWTDDSFDEWNGPASPANLRLYRDTKRNNTLVVYDEYSDRRETTRTRAYFLNKNLTTEAQNQKPRFVKIKTARCLTPLVVLPTTPTNGVEKFYAVAPPGTNCFTLFTNGLAAGQHELPAYNDGLGRMEKIAWTPVAVTADLTIIGGCVGVWWIYASGPRAGRFY
jgi:hypothetical protein